MRTRLLLLPFLSFFLTSVPAQTAPKPAPAKSEFEPAASYFQRGRAVGFPAAGKSPYLLKATFQVPTELHGLATGRYIDTFVDATHWRREAWLGPSHLVRTQDGDKRYAESDGTEASVLLMVLHVLEPIPNLQNFDDSVWQFSHDKVGDVPTVRVAYGPENSMGELVPGEAQGFWFDAAGNLLRAVTGGVDVLRLDFAPFNGVNVAQTTVVRVASGGVAMRIKLGNISPITNRPPEWTFVVANHEWKRPLIDDVR